MSLTDEQYEGLNNYVNSTPPVINMILTNENVESLVRWHYPELVDTYLAFLTIFENIPPTSEVDILYRGLSYNDNVNDLIFEHNGMISTTPDKYYASKYSNIDNPQILKIIVPPGSHVVNPGDFNVFNPYDDGEEIILLPGYLKPISRELEEINDIIMAIIAIIKIIQVYINSSFI